MATGRQAFYCLWQDERIRETLFEHLGPEDICSVRLANTACCNLVTKRLFLRTHLSFTASSFTKPYRIEALSRIGHHIEHLTFTFAHSDATFLPPLIHPETGREISFLYTPHTSMQSIFTRPKYANTGLGDILTAQYPPLFHAATNVPCFIHAISQLPALRHLTIKCPGQDPQERYRRDIVDYALMSLRIAIERAHLPRLSKLSLSGIHPSALTYLRHTPSFGCTPSSGRRWAQIRKLYIGVESWDFYGPQPGMDNLKIIDDYIRAFAPRLEKFSFTWLGRKGPCPVALGADPLFAPPRSTKKLFNEVTSPMSPLPAAPGRPPMRFPRLRCMTVRNATMNPPQVRELVAAHPPTVFNFDNVALIKGGSWDDVLERPGSSGGDSAISGVWPRTSLRESPSQAESFRTACSAPVVEDEKLPEGAQEVSSPSAAATAASRDLLELDMEGLQTFLGIGANQQAGERVETPAYDVEEWSNHIDETIEEVNEDDERDSLASDIAAAKEASLAFNTKLKNKRIESRYRKQYEPIAREEEKEISPVSSTVDEARSSEHSSSRRHHRSKHSHSSRSDRDRHSDRSHRSERSHQSDHHRSHHSDRSHRSERSERSERSHRHHRSRSHHRSSSHHRSHSHHRSRSHSRTRSKSSHHRRRHRKHSSAADSTISLPRNPHPYAHLDPPVIPLPADDVFGPPTPIPLPQQQHPALDISAPILKTPTLTRTTSSSSATTAAEAAASSSQPMLLLLQPAVYNPKAAAPAASKLNVTTTQEAGEDDGLSAVQRNFEAEEAQRRLAEDAEARTSALKKAKAAVLQKLSREFQRRLGVEVLGDRGRCGSGGSFGRGMGGAGVGSSVPRRLFGESLVSIGLGGMGGMGDHRSMESQSALVPLMFSRG